jgi:hypothetical protein
MIQFTAVNFLPKSQSRVVRDIFLVWLLALACCLAVTPAMATNSRDAIKACDANPNCNYHVGNGGVTIVVKDGKGGSTVIDCPAVNGECQVVIRKSMPTVVGPLAEVLDDFAVPNNDIFDMNFVNSGRVEAACEMVPGGAFGRVEDAHGCVNRTCAGPGEMCLVFCVDGRCFGAMPERPTGALTLIGILQNGNAVIRGGATGPAGGEGGEGGGPAAPECGIGGCGPIL